MCPQIPIQLGLCVPHSSTTHVTVTQSLFPACYRSSTQDRNRAVTPSRKQLISHGLSTNNDGSCIANQADFLMKIQPSLFLNVRILSSSWSSTRTSKSRPKGGRPQEALLYPLQGETPSSAERDRNTVGKLACHMCCKSHFYLGFQLSGYISLWVLSKILYPIRIKFCGLFEARGMMVTQYHYIPDS